MELGLAIVYNMECSKLSMSVLVNNIMVSNVVGLSMSVIKSCFRVYGKNYA